MINNRYNASHCMVLTSSASDNTDSHSVCLCNHCYLMNNVSPLYSTINIDHRQAVTSL